ncbi:hypothetical protein STENM327S_03315 [Streptomyces tendae]
MDLQVRVTPHADGAGLPAVLPSHGQGNSHQPLLPQRHAPLAHYWAAHGFAVIQPTHLTLAALALDPGTPGAPLFWRSRAEDMTRVLDGLDVLEEAVPQLSGRLDRDRVAVAGHSMGGHTASLLLGARLADPDDGTEVAGPSPASRQAPAGPPARGRQRPPRVGTRPGRAAKGSRKAVEARKAAEARAAARVRRGR